MAVPHGWPQQWGDGAGQEFDTDGSIGLLFGLG